MSIQTDLPLPSCKECDNLIISLTKKSDELDSVFKEVDTITFRHKDNLSQLKRLEEELDFKNKSLESMNNELETTKTKLGTVSDEMIELKEELVNATSKGTEGPATGNESLTLKRLRKIHADLEKEKKKMEEVHSKESGALTKAKMDLEEELRSSIATNKDLKQERKTLMGIFNCMTEVLDQKNVKIPAPKIVIDLEEDSQNDEVPLVPQMFACHICDYKTGKKEFLTKHISSDHRQQFSCEICSFKSETQELLAKHQRFQHSKNISCEFCGFKTDTAENMRNHKSEFHKVKHYLCEMCDLVLNNEQTLKTHKETHISINCEHCSFKCNSSLKMDDHKKKNHSTSCNLCDFGPDLTDNVQVHKREYHNIKGISCKK